MRKIATLNALFPTVRQGVLAATMTQPEKWWYLSELAALVDIGILVRRREGTRAYFRAEKRSPIFRELRSIFEKTAGVGPTLVELLRPFERKILCSFIYGSIARAQEHAGSDIDLMVIGAVTLSELTPALRAAEKRLQREVNATNYSAEEFRSKVAQGDHFLRSVLKTPKYFLKGSQRELEAIARP